MTDLRTQFDKAIDAIGVFSLLTQLKDKVTEAAQTAPRECGNCNHWMKRPDCPREGGLGTAVGGPSMSGLPCFKFSMKQSVLDLQAQRLGEAVAFAERYGLPIPRRS